MHSLGLSWDLRYKPLDSLYLPVLVLNCPGSECCRTSVSHLPPSLLSQTNHALSFYSFVFWFVFQLPFADRLKQAVGLHNCFISCRHLPLWLVLGFFIFCVCVWAVARTSQRGHRLPGNGVGAGGNPESNSCMPLSEVTMSCSICMPAPNTLQMPVHKYMSNESPYAFQQSFFFCFPNQSAVDFKMFWCRRVQWVTSTGRVAGVLTVFVLHPLSI